MNPVNPVINNSTLKIFLFLELFFHYFTRSLIIKPISRYRMQKNFTIAFLILFLSGSLASVAQQDPQFSQNMFTKLTSNAGYAGSSDAICGTLLYRNQWTGFGGEPKSMLLTVDMPLEVLHGGIGLTVIASDALGPEKNTNIRGAYAYRMDLGTGMLGLGVDFGYHQKSIDGGQFVMNDPNDINIPTGKISGGTFDLGFGAYYNNDNLFAGASALHLTAGDIKVDNISTTMERHYYLMAGYNAELTSSLTLRPMVQLKSDAVSTQVDFNANLMINNRFWVGASYRIQDAIVAMAGLEIIPNLRLGYAYDFTTSDIKTYSSGSHEVMLGYCYKPTKNVKRQFHRNVRFL